ncbi:acyclic terpene utilization AtuA family protein [Mycolicibacter sp. MYC340]|uniref:Acyclic terpene utilization AtuA family protein n=2 Tax=[Mycobacterium] nativiensis TaxID=2855503 RepID=A0ABU5XV97_9MYCO|nr:acyclic terpene utilization AtuA family protein [Mycolicibacter sp. MYC340]MEB3031863.1 acyclic terpene utilization AtuA family protein [Mycolicibacter sp. MYC340]
MTGTAADPLRPLRIANCSGFYGDRPSAALEMVDGGPIDFLTGDWLAELTMLILAKDRAKDPSLGYARMFPAQMEQVMGTCLDRGIKVVANAGGLNPAGCAEAVQAVADRLGLSPKIAYVAGDDLLDDLAGLQADGAELANLDTGERFGNRKAMTANAYLGCWGIVEALAHGADIVVTGRTTDASVVMGPAAWHFGWARTDWDRLAGACVAGHIIECSTQATGGNYSFFGEIPGLERPGFPLAEVTVDGSSTITKHPGTGGLVSVGTVTAQLLYEIGGPHYANPDVVARFDTIRLAQAGPDRVSVTGVRGEPAPSSLKVCINYVGGFRNSITFLLTGLDIEEKAELAERTFFANIPGGRDSFESVTSRLVRTDHHDPSTNEDAVAELTITAKDPDPKKVGRPFRNTAVEMALASYPGFYGRGMIGDAKSYGVYWPTLIPSGTCCSEVVIGAQRTVVDNTGGGLPFESPEIKASAVNLPAVPDGPTVRIELGRIVGARSGDKGGNANVGMWAQTPEAYAWLADYLTVERLSELFPEARDYPVERYELPNLLALNFVFRGILEEGVASSTRSDAQAKGLGEYLRARVVDAPKSIVPALVPSRVPSAAAPLGSIP